MDWVDHLYKDHPIGNKISERYYLNENHEAVFNYLSYFTFVFLFDVW